MIGILLQGLFTLFIIAEGMDMIYTVDRSLKERAMSAVRTACFMMTFITLVPGVESIYGKTFLLTVFNMLFLLASVIVIAQHVILMIRDRFKSKPAPTSTEATTETVSPAHSELQQTFLDVCRHYSATLSERQRDGDPMFKNHWVNEFIAHWAHWNRHHGGYSLRHIRSELSTNPQAFFEAHDLKAKYMWYKNLYELHHEKETD